MLNLKLADIQPHPVAISVSTVFLFLIFPSPPLPDSRCPRCIKTHIFSPRGGVINPTAEE